MLNRIAHAMRFVVFCRFFEKSGAKNFAFMRKLS